MANTVQYITLEYNRILNTKLDSIKDELISIERNLRINANIIIKYENTVYPNDIVEYVKEIKLGNASYNKYKINSLYRTAESKELRNVLFSKSLYEAYLINNTLHNLIPIRYKSQDNIENVNSIASAYINFYKYVIKYHRLHEQLIKYEKIQLPIFVINRFIKLYFIYASRFILRFREAKLALPHNIYIYVYGKSRKNDKTKKLKVNWGETNRNLKELSKTIDYNLYDEYNNKRITKSEFYDRIVPQLNGIKYHKYLDKDVNHWLIVNSKFSSINGVNDYGITPTNFVENKTRSQIDFANNAKNIDEIIVSNHLGFRDKIRILERFDMDFCKRTYLNNINNDL